MHEILRKLYFSPETGFVGVTAFIKQVRLKHPKFKVKDIRTWYKKQTLTQIHAPSHKVKHFIPIRREVKNEVFQIDLIDMRGEFKSTAGHNYILSVIDVATRKARAVPLKNKKAITVRDAFLKIMKTFGKPKIIEADQGREFMGAFKQMCAEKGITLRFGVPGVHRHQCFVERFNQTLIKMVARWMDNRQQSTETSTKHKLQPWHTVLPMLLRNYNKARSAVTKQKPIKKIKQKYLKLGQRVRIVIEGGRGEKLQVLRAYDPHWTENVFTIARTLTDKVTGVRGYYCIDSKGKFVGGDRPILLYKEELLAN